MLEVVISVADDGGECQHEEPTYRDDRDIARFTTYVGPLDPLTDQLPFYRFVGVGCCDTAHGSGQGYEMFVAGCTCYDFHTIVQECDPPMLQLCLDSAVWGEGFHC